MTVAVGMFDWYENIDVGIPEIWSIYQCLTLFRLVVVS